MIKEIISEFFISALELTALFVAISFTDNVLQSEYFIDIRVNLD